MRSSPGPILLLALLAGLAPASATVTPEARTVAVNGVELYVEQVGEGEPLVLLHSGTQTGRMWDPFVEALAARYRLIIPDLRGHGGSTNPDGLWSTRQFAADVIALLDRLRVGRFSAIGASAGAMTLLRIASEHPERIEALIVVGAGTSLPQACQQILSTVSTEGLTEAAWRSLRQKHRQGDDQIRALYAWVASLPEHAEDMTFTPPQLAAISAPTLVVHGDRDYCFPASMAWELYSAIPNAYLWVVPNGGHVPIQGEHTAQFTTQALTFLEGGWRAR